MAAFMERNGRWTAIVKIKPFPRRTKTFATQAEAERWATAQEADIRGGNKPRPTTWPEIQRLPRIDPEAAAVGIYFLFDGEQCVYVGQSRQVHTRVREHRARLKGRFTTYAWIPCRLEELDGLEREYIELLQPPLNTMWTFERHRAMYDRSTTQAK